MTDKTDFVFEKIYAQGFYVKPIKCSQRLEEMWKSMK